MRLDAYLARLRYPEDPTADGRTLRRLHWAHVRSIPFENIDVLLHGVVSLALEDIQDKLVLRPRGGYCYEHTVLFAAVLAGLGLPADLLAARVRLGRERPRPRTHALLKVRADGRDWIADVGFGGGGLLEPLLMEDGAQSRQGAWTFRLDRVDHSTWVLRSRRSQGWVDLYAFDDVPQTVEDLAVLNHYVSTHPDSPFVGRLRVQATYAHARMTLNDLDLAVALPDGTAEGRQLEPGELPEVLRETFGIVLESADARTLERQLAQAPMKVAR